MRFSFALLVGLASFELITSALGCCSMAASEVKSPVRSDEEVLLYPTYGALSPDGRDWVFSLHGRIYEPEENSLKRAALLSLLRRAIGLEKRASETEAFRERARLFLVDNERGKRVPVRFGERELRLRASRPNGHFTDTGRLGVVDAEKVSDTMAGGHQLRVETILRPGDARRFVGRIHLLPRDGLSVVSDIDDTIKISEVLDRDALLRNTFLEPYAAVDGMPRLYKDLAKGGASFHYVSNSPWQLYQPLDEWARQAGFPLGTYHLRHFRWKDSSFVRFVASSGSHKKTTIEALMRTYPQRRFLLVGDCGEQDPEIYGDLARRHPGQIVMILLREVRAEGTNSERLETALREVPHQKWRVFTTPGEIDAESLTALTGR